MIIALHAPSAATLAALTVCLHSDHLWCPTCIPDRRTCRDCERVDHVDCGIDDPGGYLCGDCAGGYLPCEGCGIAVPCAHDERDAIECDDCREHSATYADLERWYERERA